MFYSAEATTEIKKFPWVFKLRHNDSKMRTYYIGVAAKRELEVSSRVNMWDAWGLYAVLHSKHTKFLCWVCVRTMYCHLLLFYSVKYWSLLWLLLYSNGLLSLTRRYKK